MVVRLQETEQLGVPLPQLVEFLLLLPEAGLSVGHGRPLLCPDEFFHLRVPPRDGSGQLREYPLALHQSSLGRQLRMTGQHRVKICILRGDSAVNQSNLISHRSPGQYL